LVHAGWISSPRSVTKVAAWNAGGGVAITKGHRQSKNNIFGIMGFKVQGVPMELIKTHSYIATGTTLSSSALYIYKVNLFIFF